VHSSAFLARCPGRDDENQVIARAYDFSPFRVVIDLGGGRGGFIGEVLRANPGLRGILYDEPHVVIRPTDLQESGVASRCQIVPGDFFESVPAGCDVYVLKRVLDGWDDDHAVRILRVCRQAIPLHGRLLSIHALVPKTGPYSRKDVAILTTDMGMLVGGRGRERTEDEFRDLYCKAGFSLNRVIPTRSLLSIAEGIPA
jgi:O-methyltransferase domain